ncbi:MAG: EscJ/YscJ/HrcJ family type secretion inner rane ring protein [Parachlamydiales bacterium]|nr:EscJ/YscJ/HrcJ family type secretion inner rane ring protein [Parachlamydiales bacterium]
MRTLLRTFSVFILLLLCACEGNHSIVNNVEERDANEIVVFLASKGIEAQKVQATAGGAAAATGPSNLFNITVDADHATEAMALLTRYGLPRIQGTNLLTLFKGGGMMSTEREETIRYNAGLAEQIRNTIRKIDGILDADVQLSFPPTEIIPGAPPGKTTAAVYVKHQGVLEDPNSHIETKIKRLLAGSINGLEYDNVTVISDRSRFADISLEPNQESISGKNYQQTYASIWSIIMTKSSLTRFRVIFFTLITLVLLLAGGLGWMIYKFYPQIFQKNKGEETPPQ